MYTFNYKGPDHQHHVDKSLVVVIAFLLVLLLAIFGLAIYKDVVSHNNSVNQGLQLHQCHFDVFKEQTDKDLIIIYKDGTKTRVPLTDAVVIYDKPALKRTIK